MIYRALSLVFVMSLLFSCADAADPLCCDNGPDTDDDPSGSSEWNLVFEEEFDRDLSQWNIWFGGAFNQEIQLYRQEQLRLEGGLLLIDTARENVTGPTNIYDNTPKSFEYVSGRIESKTLFGPFDNEGDREYRFMARIKLPAGNGMWPSFWTFGDPWPTQGEIDILEARGNIPEIYQTNMFFGTTANVNINSGTDVEHDTGMDLTADFHTYEMVWTQSKIEMWFDGELLYTYQANSNNNIQNMFGKSQKIVLNTAVGGVFFGNSNPAGFANTSVMEVDWVRVYKR